MPLGRIMIEQNRDSWIAEIEAGGIAARCRVLRAHDLDEILERAREAYRELVGLQDTNAVADPASPSKRPARRGKAA